MYELNIHQSGEFDVWNSNRKKVVFKGKDALLKDKTDKLHFKQVRDLLAHISSRVSLATYRKITKQLAAW
jgi:hypothetical protein